MGSVPRETNCLGRKSTRCQNKGLVGTGWCIVDEIEGVETILLFELLKSCKTEELFTESELSNAELSNAELSKIELSWMELAWAELS